jgi:hypothetical protein
MGQDGFDHSIHLGWSCVGQYLASTFRCVHGVILPQALGFVAAHIVQQSRRPQHVHVSAFGGADALSQCQYTQDVVEIVDGVLVTVELSSLFNSDHSRWQKPCGDCGIVS